jgi:hypothetical protein
MRPARFAAAPARFLADSEVLLDSHCRSVQTRGTPGAIPLDVMWP